MDRLRSAYALATVSPGTTRGVVLKSRRKSVPGGRHIDLEHGSLLVMGIAEQRTVTDGRIVPVGKGFVRKPPKRVDYLLRYTRDLPLAVVEAKASYCSAVDGLQQAKAYGEMLGLQFDPTPDELWNRYRAAHGLADKDTAAVLTPFNHAVGKGERYYQQIAVNRVVEGILNGRRRLLVTMATGTGKTPAAFGDARHKIESAEAVKSREMYFAIYQALAEDERRAGLFRNFPP